MGSLSVITHRGLVHWQGLLLVVSLLTFWCLPTNAQFSIVSTNVAEGQEVRLQLRNMPENAIGYRWFRGKWVVRPNQVACFFPLEGKVETGNFYESGITVDRNGTLLIKDAALRDTGMYTVVAYLPNEVKQVGFGQLVVYRPVVRKPYIVASRDTVSENDSVVLYCLPSALSTEWFFNGMALQVSERRKLSKDHRTLTINPVHKEDAGYYQCKIHDPFRSAKSWAFVLYVHHE